MKALLLSIATLVSSFAAVAQVSANDIVKILGEYGTKLSFSYESDELNEIDVETDIRDEMERIEGDIKSVDLTIIGDGEFEGKFNPEEKIRLIAKKFDLKREQKDRDDDDPYILTDRKRKNITQIAIIGLDDDGSGIVMIINGDLTVEKGE
ncbi:hypothetical protein [Salibacter halophilus]|uniref:DUF4252 domain-containing protein n=1 Tax=Salibacter halophilus TaxID=1803916 RepID=A0A6N6M7S9_9FLAO|nr:hypothetical protein [Salibacter halophilus]KAB1064801.1 hypothetical protein F3059_05445 [Salibacter halophilus]